jgi:hypothetical protein
MHLSRRTLTLFLAALIILPIAMLIIHTVVEPELGAGLGTPPYNWSRFGR